MKSFFVAVIAFGTAAGPLLAGPLFDDYLNPVRPGSDTGPGSEQAVASARSPLGQTFSVEGGVGEVYRIGLRPVYETWEPGETVTLTLYTSPDRKQKLASYAIEEATSHVQPIHNTKDCVLYWHLRAPTQGRTSFYFELTVAGGNEQVAFQAMPQQKGLSYVVHIKPVADREANLRRFFTERLDIDRPELAEVKKAVQAGDWEEAIARTAMHFHQRQELWADYAAVLQEKPRLDADTELADLIMSNRFRHVETKQPVPWRPEDYWVPEFKTERAQPKRGAEPSVYTWHIDRCLAAAYTHTGKAEYARRAIDLRMQFILDNPNPKLTGVPWYFELWNDRTAAARAPGHGLLPYLRLYHYDGWTNDERLVFFSFLEDNARWDYQADSGANWGAEAARACYEFGLKFPEWKMSSEYVRWGTNRLAEIVLADVRGDGTSTEAAIKYHAMVARRLKGMLQDHVEGRIRLDDDILGRLMKTVEGMYEHMAYTLMPNSFVVMCGDSWYENFAYTPTLGIADLLDARRTITRFAKSADPISRHLRMRLVALGPAAGADAADVLKMIDAYDGSAQPSEELCRTFTALLNRLIVPSVAEPGDSEATSITEDQAWLYDEKVFADVRLRPQTRNLLKTRPTGANRELLNRMLIEDAWPDEIRKGYKANELYEAGRLVQRPDFIWIASQGLEGEPPAHISKIFPDAGYFIMRSDFGCPVNVTDERDCDYRNARQLFIHNGNWFGSHGHWDFTSVNLYAFGRPLIVDPGQYEHEPPPGIGKYWNSNIHSMLVPDGRDCKRQAGPSEWAVNSVADFFDGKHFGFQKSGRIGAVRRRIAFIKPDYFVIDDSAETEVSSSWAQCWNLSDPDAKVQENGGTIITTFPAGGNVLILNQNASRFTVEQVDGITAAKQEMPKTRIVRLTENTSRPRFQTLVYPFDGPVRPVINWQLQPADGRQADDLVYALNITSPAGQDWVAWGERGKVVRFAEGTHAMAADFAAVRRSADGAVTSFAWALGRSLNFEGKVLAEADALVHTLGVTQREDTLRVEAPEPEATLRIRAGACKRFVLNGEPVSNPALRDGMWYPFADQPRAYTADNRDDFQRLTETDEWEEKADPAAWSGSYLQHETDIGRHENGVYVLDVPETDRYRVEVFLPKITVQPSDRVEYRVIGEGRPAERSEAIVSSRSASRTHVIIVNQQAMSGWTSLGEFTLSQGKLRIAARNVTEVDGLYFIADAVRIVPSR
ncbi:MAG TPA: heparinase II/III family protein [Phycisphaerae bacterium]|nr:heparinase II/III family protein [Phycisphaerae bacterium]